MRNVLERLSPGARVAVVRLRSLGDCVLTTPALSVLKQARPDLEIAVVVEDRFAPIFTGNPDIHTILTPRASAIAAWRPQLTINFHGGARSAALTIAARSRLRAGFTHFRFRSIYNIQIPRAQEILDVDRKVHTAEHLASAMFFLGVPRREIPRARLFAKPASRSRPYAILHPTASAPDKTWAAENFRALADHVHNQLDLHPIFIGGPADDLTAFDPYETMAGASLEEIKSLLSGAALFIGNDSGPAHIAAAFGIPVLVFFGNSDPQVWAPWKTESTILTHSEGIDSISLSQAQEAIDTLPVPQPTPHHPPPK
jgi:lipopolysaccharide heptosyltransferase III